MAILELKLSPHPSNASRHRRRTGRWWLLLAAVTALPTATQACGGSFEEAPPTLPYYLDRLPAKPPAEIFRETFSGDAAFQKADLKAALLSLAGDCQAGRSAPALLATTDKLLARARLDPDQPAALCNVLNDVRDLFAAALPVTGQPAADYIRWRVEHANWFRLSWDGKPMEYGTYGGQGFTEEWQAKRRLADRETLDKLAAAGGPLAAHWLYLRGAYDFPQGGAEQFRQVVERYPDHPRAEAARFMLARCRLVASRSHGDGYGGELKPEEEAAARQERAEARLRLVAQSRRRGTDAVSPARPRLVDGTARDAFHGVGFAVHFSAGRRDGRQRAFPATLRAFAARVPGLTGSPGVRGVLRLGSVYPTGDIRRFGRIDG